MIERHLDYIQFTANFIETEFKSDEFEPLSGLPYYPRGYRDDSGTRFYFGNNRGANCFVLMAGDALEMNRSKGLIDAEILQWAFSNGAKISRLDLAVTEWIEDRLLLLKTVSNWFAKGLIDSHLVTGGCKEINELCLDGKRQRETVYVGDRKKRAKKGIFRAYDKGVDLGIGSEIATRIELELKREKAQLAAKRIAETGDIAGNFRAYFNVRHQEFDRVMDADAVDTSRGKGKLKTEKEQEMEKRWDWLINQVAPALKQAMKDDLQKLDRDDRITQFIIASGLQSEMQRAVGISSENKLRDRLYRAGLNPSEDKKE